MKNTFKAVIFDFDGVIADTMEDNFLAWKKAFLDFKIEIIPKDYYPLEGMKLILVAASIGKKYGLGDINAKKIVELKNEYYLKNHKFKFYPGIVGLINLLKSRKIKIAIVSASPRDKLTKTVPEEFLKKFDSIVSGDDTVHGKPNPEPYLKAIDSLAIPPKMCVVVENAPLGISSAKSAGAYCIAIKTTLDEHSLSKADIIVKNHDELIKKIDDIFKKRGKIPYSKKD